MLWAQIPVYFNCEFWIRRTAHNTKATLLETELTGEMRVSKNVTKWQWQPTTTTTTSNQIEMSTSLYRGVFLMYNVRNKRTKNKMFSMRFNFPAKTYNREWISRNHLHSSPFVQACFRSLIPFLGFSTLCVHCIHIYCIYCDCDILTPQ